MTPLNPGLYEFKNDSLIEIRKKIGISQSRMADLLGIPPNTLSRWETGNTVPDASVLAAVYSLAKEQGISDIPPFFGFRKAPVEVKMGSKPSGQLADSLSFYQSFRSFLQTQIELTGLELTPVMKIEIHNTAPVTPEWPKIVFTGVGLSLAHTGADTQALLPSNLKIRTNRKSEEMSITKSPWQLDTKRERLSKLTFSRTDRKEFPEITLDEGQHGEVLFPGQSVIYEIDVTNELLPYLQFKVEGTVSRRHLFHCEEIFVMPENITKPLAISAFNDFNNLDSYSPLEDVISSMPKFDNDIRLEEVQNFSKVLSDNTTKIKKIQDELNNVFRQNKFFWFRAHLRSTFIYLDRVNAAFASMQEAIKSNSSDRIAAEASALKALTEESALLDAETLELMHANNISKEELRISNSSKLKRW